MNTQVSMPSEEDLNAFIDGELDDQRSKEVVAALALNSVLAAKVAEMRLQQENLRFLAKPILNEPVPDRLTRIVRSRAEPVSTRRSPPKRAVLPLLWQVGALAATLLLGVGVGWYGQTVYSANQSLLDPFVEQAVLSHRLFESTRDFDRIDGDSEVISIEADARPFALPARTPSLRQSNLVPVMVRKVEGEPGDAIHIAYEDKTGEWTTLFIRKNSEGARLPTRFEQRDGYSILYWLDGPLVYALVGTEGEDELRTMAEDIYRSKAVSGLQAEEPEQDIKPAVAR